MQGKTGITSQDIISLLDCDEWVSGERIAGQLYISRAAVWKHIQILRRRGYAISSSTRKGYRLVSRPDFLDSDQIQRGLHTKWMGRSIKIFDAVTSTNAIALSRALESPHGTVILSETQSQGKGRLSRPWSSPPGGIWMSLIFKPKMPLAYIAKVNMAVSVALCRAILAETGLWAGIKWPNDIMIGERKVCGILTEMKAEVDRLDYVVVGIGLNVNVDLTLYPVQWMSTSLEAEAGQAISRTDLICRILDEVENAYEKAAGDIDQAQEIYQEWQRLSVTIDRWVRINSIAGDMVGRASDLAADGALILESDEGCRRILAGDCIHLRAIGPEGPILPDHADHEGPEYSNDAGRVKAT